VVRALVRDAGRAGPRLGDGVDLAVGDFEDPVSLRRALQGIDAVFLTSADGPRKVEHENAVIDAAAAAGTPKVVKLASIGTRTGAPLSTWDWHGRIVDHLRASRLPHAVLQANFFMSNLFMAADSIRSAGKIFAPAAGARIAMIDPRDVAAAAAAVLTAVPRSSDAEAATHVLSGPEAIGYDDVAAHLSAALGRRIEFVPVPDAAAGAALVEAGMPDWLVEFLPKMFGVLRAGQAAEVTDAVHRLTGRAPRGFATFARDHAAAFAG
jgi:uncharacterized protein YbjT (DUF2867 family)